MMRAPVRWAMASASLQVDRTITGEPLVGGGEHDELAGQQDRRLLAAADGDGMLGDAARRRWVAGREEGEGAHPVDGVPHPEASVDPAAGERLEQVDDVGGAARRGRRPQRRRRGSSIAIGPEAAARSAAHTPCRERRRGGSPPRSCDRSAPAAAQARASKSPALMVGGSDSICGSQHGRFGFQPAPQLGDDVPQGVGVEAASAFDAGRSRSQSRAQRRSRSPSRSAHGDVTCESCSRSGRCIALRGRLVPVRHRGAVTELAAAPRQLLADRRS